MSSEGSPHEAFQSRRGGGCGINTDVSCLTPRVVEVELISVTDQM